MLVSLSLIPEYNTVICFLHLELRGIITITNCTG